MPEGLNATLLHETFLHRCMEKVFKTLIHTRGYVAQRLPDPFCSVCAQAKAQRRGLHQHASLALFAAVKNTPGVMYQAYVLVTKVVQAHVEVYDDDNNDDTSSDEGNESKLEIQYVSPVAGRALGAVPVPRFDLAKLRPFEVMFVDNKDYEQAVRGGRQTTFILYDVCSTAKFKVDIFKKTENGVALREILAMNGVHKLPYSCVVYSDGCGSMRHVEIAAVTMGLQHAYIPPHEQSLNEAEKICSCLVTWDDAAALMIRAEGISPRLFNEAVSYSLYVDMCMSTTASRGFKTPLEIIRGVVLDITKLHRFYTCSFVCVPRQKRKQLAGKGFIGRAEVGRLMGFRSPFSTTYKVLLSADRMVHY